MRHFPKLNLKRKLNIIGLVVVNVVDGQSNMSHLHLCIVVIKERHNSSTNVVIVLLTHKRVRMFV